MAMKTLFEILQAGTAYLAQRGCPDARHSMQSLLTHVLKCDKTSLYLQWERPMEEEHLAELRVFLQRRGRGEPLQHLLGSVEFYRRPFKSDARALIPRPETEELVEKVLKRARPQSGMRILDMGTGSGVIGITLALELADFSPETVLADVSPEALGLALENATSLGARVKTFRSDLFSAWNASADAGGTEQNAFSTSIRPPAPFHLVLANLPYIPNGEELQTEVRHDPATALFGGVEGTELIGRFLREVLPFLAPEALVALEVGYDQGDCVAQMMGELGYAGVHVESDLGGIPRFPMGYAPNLPASESADCLRSEQAAAAPEEGPL